MAFARTCLLARQCPVMSVGSDVRLYGSRARTLGLYYRRSYICRLNAVYLMYSTDRIFYGIHIYVCVIGTEGWFTVTARGSSPTAHQISERYTIHFLLFFSLSSSFAPFLFLSSPFQLLHPPWRSTRRKRHRALSSMYTSDI